MEPLGLYGLLEGIRVSSSTLQSGAGRSSQSICSPTPSAFSSLTRQFSTTDERANIHVAAPNQCDKSRFVLQICSPTATETKIILKIYYIADCMRKTGWVRTSRSYSSSEESTVTFKYGRTKRERYTRISTAGMPGGPEPTASRKMGAAASGGSSMARILSARRLRVMVASPPAARRLRTQLTIP